MKKISDRQKEILNIIKKRKALSISQIKELLSSQVSIPSLNRDLANLVLSRFLLRKGTGRSIYYILSPYYSLISSYDIDTYFNTDIDHRNGKKSFNFNIFDILKEIDVLDQQKIAFLEKLKNGYQNNIKKLSSTIYKKELERITIELSWKSSQIEGNTYSLLETERLLIEKETVATKPKEDAIMLLNHKIALDYIVAHKDLGKELSLKLIEEIHSLLVQDLGVKRNIRSNSVGITGSSYVPLDNEHQIKESLEKMCHLINSKANAFEKALLTLVLISYIQPFEDGNKRTSRMVSTAILIAYGACPLSYRNVNAIEYKKAMLLFYEQNNITAFNKIFIEQNIFAYQNYFL